MFWCWCLTVRVVNYVIVMICYFSVIQASIELDRINYIWIDDSNVDSRLLY